MSRGGEVAARLDRGVHRFDLHGRVIESFRTYGVPCVILPGVLGANGYVQLPRSVKRALRGTRDAAGELGFGRRLTYSCDAAGWIGFDTSMPGDCWSAGDYETLAIDVNMARSLDGGYRVPPLPGFKPVHWTLQRIHDRVVELACLVDLYRLSHRRSPYAWWLDRRAGSVFEKEVS